MSASSSQSLLDGPHRRRSLPQCRLFQPMVYRVLLGGASLFAIVLAAALV